jgi:uncharacterized coiled-coil protein SlyX
MPNFCQGIPDGPCPSECCDASVKFTVYDLFLCPQCERFRETLQSSSTEHSDFVTKSARHVTKGRKGRINSNVEVTQMHSQTTSDDALHALDTRENVGSEPVSVGACGGTDEDRFRQLEALIYELNKTVAEQDERIKQMSAQMNLLVSLLGISDTKITNTDVNMDVALCKPSVSSMRENSTPTYAAVASKFRTTIAATMHSEQRSMNVRARNFVVAGLSTSAEQTDNQLVTDLVTNKLHLTVNVLNCQRLGTLQADKIQRLLVTTASAAQAAEIIAAAKRLRGHTDPGTRKPVFINADMTPAEQKAAYEARCHRRENKQRRPVDSANVYPSQPAGSSPALVAVNTTSAAGGVIGMNENGRPVTTFNTTTGAVLTLSALAPAFNPPSAAVSVSASAISPVISPSVNVTEAVSAASNKTTPSKSNVIAARRPVDNHS